jgi:hypothetical protein
MGYLVDIDSGERDPIEYPNPNDYTVHLNTRIYDITSIKLVAARIPNCQPLINSGNKQFEVNGATVVFDEGTYTNGTDLASNLQIQMAPPNTVIDTVSFDSFTNKLTFTNTSPLHSINVGYSVLGTETASNLQSLGDVIYNSRDDDLLFGDNVISINFLTGESFANSMNSSSLISPTSLINGITFNSPDLNFSYDIANVIFDSNIVSLASMLESNIGLSTTITDFDSITFNSVTSNLEFSNTQLATTTNVEIVNGYSFANAMNLSSLVSSSDYIDYVFFTPAPHSNIEFANIETSTTTNVYFDTDGTNMAAMLLANIGVATTITDFDSITFDGGDTYQFTFSNTLSSDPPDVVTPYYEANYFANQMSTEVAPSVDSIVSVYFDDKFKFSNTLGVHFDSNGTHMAEMLLANIGSSTSITDFDSITYDGTYNHFKFGDTNISFVSGNTLATDILAVLDTNTSIDSITFDSDTSNLVFSNTLGGVFDDFEVSMSNIGSTLANTIQVQAPEASNLLLSSFDISTNLLSFSNTSFTTLGFSTDGETMTETLETSGLVSGRRLVFNPETSNIEFYNDFTFNFYGGSNGYATSSEVGPPAHLLGFSGANTELANSVTSSYIDLNGPTSIFVRITSGLEDLDKQLFIDGGTFSTGGGTFDSQNMKQISPHYIGRILTSNVNEIIDFNGHDDPIHHTFIKGTGRFIDDLRIRFYYNNGTKLIPYDFGKRNHFLKIEIECSLEKGMGTVLEQSNAFGVDSGDLPPPVEIPNLMPKNRFDNSQKTILIVSVISLLMGLALLSFMRRKKTL